MGNAKTPFETLPVCSDDTVRCGEDDALMSSTLDLGYPSTTDPDDVRTFLKRRGPRVVSATYQSSPVIADALANTRHRFDLVIADEAIGAPVRYRVRSRPCWTSRRFRPANGSL